MSDPKPKAVPGAVPADVEPLPRAGIGVPMQDLAPQTVTLPPAPVVETSGFDAWLRSHLAQLHAGVLAEPVPDRFLRLLGVVPEGPAD